MKKLNLEQMIQSVMTPKKFISGYGTQYDGYYVSVPGDKCGRCGKTAVGHYLTQIYDKAELLPSGNRMYLACAITDEDS